VRQLDSLLQRFDLMAGGGPYEYGRHYYHDGGRHDYHVVVGALTHGDEVGSLPSVVALAEALEAGIQAFGGRLTVFLGNPEASVEGKRFLEQDLNRVFVAEPPACHEGDRARMLMPILDQADVFFDLHQTICATDRPFYTFPFSVDGWHWVRAVGGASSWVTRAPGVAFSTGTVNVDEYVRRRHKPGVTLELSQKGFAEEADQLATNVLKRLLAVAERVAVNPASLATLADEQPEPEFIETAWRKSFDDPRLRLRPGLRNFQLVTQGERLSEIGTPTIEAPHDGLILFPKYPTYLDSGEVVEPRPGEIVHIAQPLSDHPLQVWAKELTN